MWFRNVSKISAAVKRLLSKTGSRILQVIALLTGIWSIGVVYFLLLPEAWQTGGTIAYTLSYLAVWGATFRWHRLAWGVWGLNIFMIIYFAGVDAGKRFQATRWQTPWAREPVVVFDSEHRVVVRNIRDFHYRSEHDYTVNYVTWQLDLHRVESVDLILSYWEGNKAIAHSMLSFGWPDGEYLTVSMETRLPEGCIQNGLAGLYKQYGLLMILGTERDLLKLRTDFRGEELYLYRTNATPEQARFILANILRGTDRMYLQPQFYNSLTRNCTTSLAPLLKLVEPGFERDIRLLLNGFSAEMLYEAGYLRHRPGESFQALQQRRKVNQYLPEKPQGNEDYSKLIRCNL